jgi:hypothetical protein
MIAELLHTYMHYVRLAFIAEDVAANSHRSCHEEYVDEGDAARHREQLVDQSARAVREAVKHAHGKPVANRWTATNGPSTLLFLQHMNLARGLPPTVRSSSPQDERARPSRRSGRRAPDHGAVWMRKTLRSHAKWKSGQRDRPQALYSS